MFGLAAVNLAKNPDGILGLTAQRRWERAQRREARRLEREELLRQSAEPLEPPAVVTPLVAPPVTPDTRPEAITLELRGIHAGYGDVEVLHGIDLIVPAGTSVAIIGANGAGKSTLCGVSAGTVGARAGSVLLDGTDVTSLSPSRRAGAGVFMVPEGRGIFPSLSVEENLGLWLANRAEREVAYERFPSLGPRRSQLAGALSGGEQQMLALAPALVRPPLLLIADEPSLGLAPRIVGEVYDALEALKQRRTAVLLVEEKAHDVVRFCDTVVFLQVGRIAWTAPAPDVDEERLVHSYLGMDLDVTEDATGLDRSWNR